MKVILVSGSPNKDGNTMYALREVASAIEACGVEAELISLSGKNIRGCVNCGACFKREGCALKDDFNEICEKVKAAEGFIIGSPVYFGTARGDVLNLLQRLGMQHKRNDNCLTGKVGGPVAIGRRGGHTATIQELQMFYTICGMVVPGANYWNLIFAHMPGDAAKDEDGLANLRTFGTRVAELIKLKANA